MHPPPRVEKVVTAGTFALDGGEWPVENNVWLVGDDHEVLVVDASHDASAVLAGVGDRRVVAIVLSHGHNDHLNAAVEVAAATEAEIALHPADRMLWSMEYGDLSPDIQLADGGSFEVAGTRLAVLHTPGHSPGSVCLYAADLGLVFSGDTLFRSGPGPTNRSFSDRPTILASIRRSLLTLPPDTVVHPGHGADTLVSEQVARLR